MNNKVRNIMEAAEPIFLSGNNSSACLLIHGFSSSPFEMKELGENLNKAGYTIRIPLLPGHGTTPESLITVTWNDWHRNVVHEFEELRNLYSKVYVIGQSLGGSLALHISAHYRPDAIIALVPGLFLKNEWAQYTRYYVRYLKQYMIRKKDADISNKAATVGYKRYPIKAVHELTKFFKHLRDDLSDVKTDVLLITAKNDHVVKAKSGQYIFRSISAKHKKHIELEKSFHIATLDIEKKKVFEEVLNFLQTRPEGTEH